MKPFLILAIFLTGCGTTRIVSDDPFAEIYLNDRMIGVGEANVNRVGPYRRVNLEAKKDGKTIGKQEMHRSFRFMTVVWGACSYYTGLYWGWYYPDYVRIPVQMLAVSAVNQGKNIWSEPRQSIWMKPLK